MSYPPKTASDQMLKSIGTRLYVARLTRIFLICVCGLSVIAALAMPAFWLTSEVDWRTTLAVIPVVIAAALLLALVLTRRPTATEAARAADRAIDGKDLFLSLARVRDAGTTAGDFAPLVIRDAEAAAKRVDPHRAVPIIWARLLAWAGGGVALAIVAGLLVPRFDPLGTEAAAEEIADQEAALKQRDEKTEKQLKELRQKFPSAKLSEEITKAIEDFKKSLKRMKPNQQQQNRKRLGKEQKELGAKWRLKSAKALKNSLAKDSDQQFGMRIDGVQLRKWKKELQQGSTESLRKEMESLKKELQKLAKMEDPVKRQQQLRKVEKRLDTLQRFASEVAGSKPLAATLKRAMKQLDAARKAGAGTKEQKKIARKALESMKKSLDLSQLQLEEIAQSARDLKKLEQALKTLQMAKKANASKGLNGEACENCVSLADYQAFYQELVKKYGKGNGLGGAGFGEGGEAPEDPTAKTGFTPEMSKSAITAGKILLSIKTKGMTDSGEAVKDYSKQIKKVKQGVSEAILNEQVPPGYHEEIKEYFDTLKAKEK